MDKSVVRIKINKKDFWKKYLELLNPVLKLRDKEREVFSCILVLVTGNKNNPNLEKQLLGYKSRVKIRTYVDISEASLNNNICNLRKRGFILKTNNGYKVHPNFMDVDYDKEHIVEFKMTITC